MKIFSFLFCLFICSHLYSTDIEKQVFTYYENGINATTVFEREQNWNKALEILLTKEQALGTSSSLFLNIGNIFFLLEEYPWAYYYFSRAKKIAPNNPDVLFSIELINKKLNTNEKKSPNIFSLFFLHGFISSETLIKLLGILIILSFISYSFYIWTEINLFQFFFFCINIISGYIFLCICYSLYFSPINGIVIEASDLYREANFLSPIGLPIPVLPGEKLEVLDTAANGLWLKVITTEGKIGYIPNNKIRVY